MLLSRTHLQLNENIPLVLDNVDNYINSETEIGPILMNLKSVVIISSLATINR